MTGASGVGFSEVRIPGVTVAETIQLPSDLLRALGSASLSHRLTLVLTRDRVVADPASLRPGARDEPHVLAADRPVVLARAGPPASRRSSPTT